MDRYRRDCKERVRAIKGNRGLAGLCLQLPSSGAIRAFFLLAAGLGILSSRFWKVSHRSCILRGPYELQSRESRAMLRMAT